MTTPTPDLPHPSAAFLADKSPGSEYHLTLLMAPHQLHAVTGQDRQHLLAFARDVWAAALAAQSAPPGWKLVPVEPTKEMVEAAFDALPYSALEGNIRRYYRAMLAAAPSAPQQSAEPLPPCDAEVFERGESVCMLAVPKEHAEAACKIASALTGDRYDWHYIAGRVHVKRLAAPQPPAQPSLEVVAITTAYEQGFGHARRDELSNPYKSGTPEAEAWDIGREEGKRKPPEQPADEALLRQALEALEVGSGYAESERQQNAERYKGYEHLAPDDASCVRQIDAAIAALRALLEGEPATVRPLTRDQIGALDAGCGHAFLHWDTRVSLARAVERACAEAWGLRLEGER